MPTLKGFRLIKPLGNYKVRKIYNPMGGLVTGLNAEHAYIRFTNTEYFKPVYKKTEFDNFCLALHKCMRKKSDVYLAEAEDIICAIARSTTLNKNERNHLVTMYENFIDSLI